MSQWQSGFHFCDIKRAWVSQFLHSSFIKAACRLIAGSCIIFCFLVCTQDAKPISLRTSALFSQDSFEGCSEARPKVVPCVFCCPSRSLILCARQSCSEENDKGSSLPGKSQSAIPLTPSLSPTKSTPGSKSCGFEGFW